MTSKRKLKYLEPEELAGEVNWENFRDNGYGMYAFYPPVMYQYPRGLLLYTKGELDRMQETFKTHQKTKIPEDSGIFSSRVMWPPPISCKMPLTRKIKNEIKQMTYEDIRKKYPFLANAPASPFMEKRLSPKVPSSWECDDTINKTHDEIVATLVRPMRISRDQKHYRPTDFPAIHSDGYHAIHPSWYYQPSTFIRYVNPNAHVCGKNKRELEDEEEDEEEII